MDLTMKQRFARLDLSKLPANYKAEFDEMQRETVDFSDNELNAVFAENFEDMYKLVEKKYPDAIKKGGTVTKEKPAKVKIVKAKGVKDLPITEYKGKPYYVDFKLEEMRDFETAESMPFKDMPEILKAKLRGIRAEFGPNVHIASLDDGDKMTAEEEKEFKKASDKFLGKDRKKLSQEDIVFIEDQLVNDGESTDEEMIAHFIKETGMSETQAKKWVELRDKYLRRSVEKNINYPTRTSLKKAARKGSDIVKTRDDKEIDRKSNKNIGKTFFDENGKEWKCKGYNAKLDECILEDKDGKEISSCIKDMYVNNPVAKREKGNMVDECRETLKEAGYTVKEHKAGGKKIKRSAPRPEKAIIRERVGDTFTPILKDLKGSEEKETENKATIAILESIQGLFTKFMNRISNLADDGKLEQLKKIEKLLKEIVD